MSPTRPRPPPDQAARQAARRIRRPTPPLLTADEIEVSPAERHVEWDEVDEASWQSFPASDPPAWSPRASALR